MSNIIQIKRGEGIPVDILKDGELGYSTNLKKIYIGLENGEVESIGIRLDENNIFSASQTLANAKYIYGKLADETSIRLLGISANDNLLFGDATKPDEPIYIYGNLNLNHPLAITEGGTGANLSEVPTGAIITKSSSDKLTYWNNVPIEHGGTEASDRATGLLNLLFLGNNPVVASDTREEWEKHKNFIAYFNSSATVINKPPGVAANGMMQQISTGNVLHQIWYEYSKNNIYTRSANTAGWSGSASVSGADAWSKVLNTDNSVTTVAATGTDLNDYKEFGWYYFSSSYTPTNIPAGSNGWLQVVTTSGSAVKQFWYRMGTINSNDYQTFVRTFNGTNWGDWRTTLTDKNGVTMKKVWTNAKPTSNFAAQKISFTKETNDLVLITFISTIGDNVKDSIISYNGSCVLHSITHVDAGSEPPYIYDRRVDIANTGATFGACTMKVTTGGTLYNNENGGCVPQNIYVIKGVL